jgi:hypothetical protein
MISIALEVWDKARSLELWRAPLSVSKLGKGYSPGRAVLD